MMYTSEAVRRGHPDKMADAIADSILDAYLMQDPDARVACEVLIKNEHVVLGGEITSSATISSESIVSSVFRNAGYDSYPKCTIHELFTKQDHELAETIESHGKIASGDQVVTWGYATDETEEFLPLPYVIAQKIVTSMDQNPLPILSADGKVLCGFDKGLASSILLSLQSKPDIPCQEFETALMDYIHSLLGAIITPATSFHVNQFFAGGPHVDCGMTGRKLMIDTYGTLAFHGGGSFSGKDPTKMDRSGAYAARYIAKNIVASGVAQQCTVQLSYCIGLQDPIGLAIETYNDYDKEKLVTIVKDNFPLQPLEIIESFDLQRPMYADLSFGGHFGRNTPWEVCDKTDVF